MDYIFLQKRIAQLIHKCVDYLETKEYFSDINFYSLYTDESFMSLTLCFNTNQYLKEKTEEDGYEEDEYLHYKYSPDEWFSEDIKDDTIDLFFNEINMELQKYSLYDSSDFKKHKISFSNACVSAIEEINTIGVLAKHSPIIFMISDCDEEKLIKNCNSKLLDKKILKELMSVF